MTFQITYFLADGKFYKCVNVPYDIEHLKIPERALSYVCAKLKLMRDSDAPGVMPGLLPENVGWDGAIMVQELGMEGLTVTKGIQRLIPQKP